MAKPIPDGFRTVTPHLIVAGGKDAIEFYKNAFGAEEVMRMPMPDGSDIMHAEIRIGDSLVMLGTEAPQWGVRGPKSLGGSSVTVHLYVNDVDAVVARAVEAGAEVMMPVRDVFWGDRYAKLKDPFGHEWSVATHTRDMTPEETAREAEAFFASMGKEGCQQDE
ncbi:MAG: VOC family protein [Acidobacteriota bacterium]|nr:MAG: VOC family protein [Acidobacteriota bacterium]